MLIRKLTLLNFKNIKQAEIEFSPKINCFIGSNGSGKTNVLDAIYYLSYCKSHTNTIDSQNITHEEEFFVIQGDYVVGGNDEHVYCGLKRRQKKQFKRNKKDYGRLSDHIGMLPLVLISPDDQQLISEGSGERRRFIDSIISQYDKEYLHVLIQYNNALMQRNSLLKSNCRDTSLFEVMEEQLAEYGKHIFEKRKQFLCEFLPIFQQFYNYLSQEKETVGLNYQSQLDEDDLLPMLKHSRERDSILGYTSKGVHKDELEMLLESYPIKRIGSQGQNKTYLIALKLAQFTFLKNISKKTPIFLLDDIFDKLDRERVMQIIRLVGEENFGQIFITDTNREHLDQMLLHLKQDAWIFAVEQGEIIKT